MGMEEYNSENQTQSTEKSVSVWGKVLSTSVGLPFVKVNREEFLNKELSKFCTPMEVMTAIDEGPLGVLTKKEIDKLANQCISYHLTMVCGTSALMGLDLYTFRPPLASTTKAAGSRQAARLAG